MAGLRDPSDLHVANLDGAPSALAVRGDLSRGDRSGGVTRLDAPVEFLTDQGFGMRLSRHAKNEVRLYRLTSADVEAVIAAPQDREVDDRGDAQLTGQARDGRPILVIVAGDDPKFVITVFVRS